MGGATSTDMYGISMAWRSRAREKEKGLRQIDDHGLMAREKVARNIHAKDQSHMTLFGWDTE